MKTLINQYGLSREILNTSINGINDMKVFLDRHFLAEMTPIHELKKEHLIHGNLLTDEQFEHYKQKLIQVKKQKKS